jgi:hypothetical protein
VFAVRQCPGFVAAAMMGRMGRRPIQILGFAMMSASFLAMALIPGIERLIHFSSFTGHQLVVCEEPAFKRRM